MKQIFTEILFVASVFVILFFSSCNNESGTNKSANENDTLSFTSSLNDSFAYTGFNAAKWVAFSDDVKEENSFGYADRGERIEKRITKELENIDPLEYYLSDYQHVKFTDKKEMNRIKKKLVRLNRIYRTNYYQSGHIEERRNNMLTLATLNNKNSDSGKRLGKRSESFPHNANIAQLKSGNNNNPITTSDDPKSLLNVAVQLLNIAQLSEPANRMNLLSEAEQSLNLLKSIKLFTDDYLLNYNKAFIRYNYSDFQGAILYGKKSIAVRKDFYLGYLLVGDAYLSEGDMENAYLNYYDALKIKKNIVTLERTAYAALFLGKGDIAEDCYSKILFKKDYNRSDRQNYKVGYALALAYNGKHELSMEIARDIRGWRQNWAVTWIIEGWNELILGNYDAAEKSFIQAHKKGDALFSKIGIAYLKFRTKDYASSARIFNDLDNTAEYQSISTHPSLLLYSGFSYANTYDYNSAILKFTDYGYCKKKDDYYYLGMGLCYLGFGAYRDAKYYIDSVSTETGASSDYYCLKGVCALRNDEYLNAKIFFEKALRLDNRNLRCINGLGSSLAGLEKFEQSIAAFDDGLKLHPGDAYLLFNKADAIFTISRKLMEAGSVQLAKDTIKYGLQLTNKALSIEPGWSIDAYLNIGNAYSGIKDSIHALSYYKKATPLAAEVNTGVLYANENMIDKAKKIWEQVLEIDSTLDLVAYNIKAIDMPTDGKKMRRQDRQPRFKYYCIYHDKLLYHIDYPYSVLVKKYFEPLPPLGHSNLKLAKINDKKDK